MVASLRGRRAGVTSASARRFSRREPGAAGQRREGQRWPAVATVARWPCRRQDGQWAALSAEPEQLPVPWHPPPHPPRGQAGAVVLGGRLEARVPPSLPWPRCNHEHRCWWHPPCPSWPSRPAKPGGGDGWDPLPAGRVGVPEVPRSRWRGLWVAWGAPGRNGTGAGL